MTNIHIYDIYFKPAVRTPSALRTLVLVKNYRNPHPIPRERVTKDLEDRPKDIKIFDCQNRPQSLPSQIPLINESPSRKREHEPKCTPHKHPRIQIETKTRYLEHKIKYPCYEKIIIFNFETNFEKERRNHKRRKEKTSADKKEHN